jgi:hypothetical protein
LEGNEALATEILKNQSEECERTLAKKPLNNELPVTKSQVYKNIWRNSC